jgi:hypothetical protein
MVMFAETAIFDYRLSFADREKQLLFSISICSKQKWKFAIYIFHLQQTNGSCHFPLVRLGSARYFYVSIDL